MRPLNSSHWRMGLISTGATLTAGGGGAAVSAAQAIDDAAFYGRDDVAGRLDATWERVAAGRDGIEALVVVDGVRLHPDLGYPALRIAVEYEGEGHLDPKRWADDILRYEMLEAAGWIVVRITKADVAGSGVRCARRVRALARRA